MNSDFLKSLDNLQDKYKLKVNKINHKINAGTSSKTIILTKQEFENKANICKTIKTISLDKIKENCLSRPLATKKELSLITLIPEKKINEYLLTISTDLSLQSFSNKHSHFWSQKTIASYLGIKKTISSSRKDTYINIMDKALHDFFCGATISEVSRDNSINYRELRNKILEIENTEKCNKYFDESNDSSSSEVLLMLENAAIQKGFIIESKEHHKIFKLLNSKSIKSTALLYHKDALSITAFAVDTKSILKKSINYLAKNSKKTNKCVLYVKADLFNDAVIYRNKISSPENLRIFIFHKNITVQFKRYLKNLIMQYKKQ